MENQILKEIREIRRLLSRLIGTSDLPTRKQFSQETLDKAAQEFKNLSIERGEWITNDEISKIIKKAPYNAGKFIIVKFGFTNYFKRGHILYFNRKDIIALNNELKKRNINLKRYMELLDDQEKFKKYVASIRNQKGKKKRKIFHIPEGLRDIETIPYTPPSKDIINKHIADLKEEFQKSNLSEYIDVYNDSYAMFKFEYCFDRYLDAGMKKLCKTWCFEFNYAHDALKEIFIRHSK